MHDIYFIHEDNIDRLEKQLKTIQNKCNKQGVEFGYRKGDEVYKQVTDDETGYTYTARFIEVEAWGHVEVNGWIFIAVIEHMDGKGRNIVRQFNTNYDIPARYYTVRPTCEHCNTNRTRKQTYLLVNQETGEFKQVGGSCLKEFTGGLDAERLVAYISCFDKLIAGESFTGSESSRVKYFDTKYILQITAQVVKAIGYSNSNSEAPTYLKVHKVHNFLQGYMMPSKERDDIEAFVNKHHIDPDSSKEDVDAMIKWILNDADCSFGYMMNLRAVVDTEYVKLKHFGLLCSAVPTYNREMEKLAAQKVREEQLEQEAANSSYVADKGQKFTVKVAYCKCLTSWDTQFGTTYVYKFVDTLGRVIIWKTSNTFCVDRVIQLSGKVKDHDTYQGVKQTVAYFCKVVELPPEDDKPSEDDMKDIEKAQAELTEALNMLYEDYEDPRDTYSPSQPWNAPGMQVSDFIR